ncbi:MAG: hypothetical protein Q9196_005152 [Gyalolechia fulgens]
MFIPDPRKGTIIAKNIHSPLQRGLPNQPLPALHRWSDVVWQNWTGVAGAQARHLRYVIRENIITPDVRRLIEYVEIAARPDDLDLPWPGTVYDMRSDDGRALLGSAHGLGVAWLVIDHSNVLGRKIPAVRVFTAASMENPAFRQFNWLYYLVWELRDTDQFRRSIFLSYPTESVLPSYAVKPVLSWFLAESTLSFQQSTIRETRISPSNTESRHLFRGLLVIAFSILLLFLSAKPFHHRHSIYNNSEPASQHLGRDIGAKNAMPSGLGDLYNLTLSAVGSGSLLAERAMDYDNLVCKGGIALRMLRNDPPSPQVWTQRDLDVAWNVEDEDWDPNEALSQALHGLGIPPEYDPDVTFHQEADQSRFFRGADGQEKQPTGGHYSNTYIPSRGTIIAERNYSPRYQAPGNEAPVLNRWSDIAWLLWSQKAGNRAGGLRTIIRENITTPLTRALMEYIEVAGPDDLDLPYPGMLYNMRSELRKSAPRVPTWHRRGLYAQRPPGHTWA